MSRSNDPVPVETRLQLVLTVASRVTHRQLTACIQADLFYRVGTLSS